MANSKLCTGCQRYNKDILADSWCSDCGEYCCNVCGKVHNVLAKTHKLVPIHQVNQLSTSVMQLSMTCARHPDQNISRFCCQHDKVICPSCLSETHQNCNTITSLEQAAKGVHNGTALQYLEQRLSILVKHTEDILKDFAKNTSYLNDRKQQIQDDIHNTRQRINAQLDKIETELKNELTQKHKLCVEKIKTQNYMVQNKYRNLNTWANDIKLVKSHASEVHLFQIVKFLDVKCHDAEMTIQDIQSHASLLDIKFELQENPIFQELSALFGKLTLSETRLSVPDTPRIGSEGQCATNKNHQKLQLLSRLDLGGDGVYLENCRFIDKNYISSAVVERGETCINICKHDGSDSVRLSLNRNPRIIENIKENPIMVAEYKRLQVNYQMCELRRYRKLENCWACFDGTICVRTGFMNLTWADVEGKVLRKTQTTEDPNRICFSPSGHLYYTTSSGAVYIIPPNEKNRLFYSHDDVKYCDGIAVDSNGDVYVCGNENTIHKISHDGTSSAIILTVDDGIYCPSALDFNHEIKQLLVVNNKETVSIYSVA